jgi:hypothetical protein
MLYKIKMFFLWILQNVSEFIMENKKDLWMITKFYIIVAGSIWFIVDIGLPDNKFNFLRTGQIHDLMAKPSYILLAVLIIGYVIMWTKQFIQFSRELFKELYKSYQSFIIEGPKKKKKDGEWVETTEYRNPLDSPDAVDVYFDKDGNFDEDRFDADLKEQLDRKLKESNGQKT